MKNTLLIIKALSDKNRLRIVLSLMTYGKLCACQISELLGVSGATTSRHLSLLTNTEIIKSKKTGRWVYYSIDLNANKSKPILEWIKKESIQSEDFISDKNIMDSILSKNIEEVCK